MSAVIQNEYTGNGSTTTYSFTFPYLKTSDIKASLDGVDTTAFTLPNATTLQFNTAPTNGAKIKIFRQTGVDNLTATFYAGSAIKSEDLNDNFTQNLYKTQEVGARFVSKLGSTMTGDLTMGEDTVIKFEGATDDAHETTLTVVDPTADRTITFPNITGTVITTSDTGTVATGMIAADAVNGDKIADNAINSEHYTDGSIDRVHLAADIVDGTKIADDSINSEHYVADSIDTEHYAAGSVDATALASNAVTGVKIIADAVDGTKIADNSINSEHYVDGSIDNEHIADNAINQAKMADDSVGTAELVDGSVDTDRLADGSVTTAKIAADAVTGAEIGDDQINSEHYAADSIDTEHYAPNSVDTTALAADAVTGAQLADNAVDSEHFVDGSIDLIHMSANSVDSDQYVDGSIDRVHLEADIIDSTKLADDAVNSEHYVDGSIDTDHIGGAQVTDAKLASNSVTESKITDGNVTTVKIVDSGVTLAKLASDLKTTTIADSDTQLPTSGAVVDYVAAQIAPIGGLEVIATELAFPNTQPAAGVVISIADAGGIVVNGSGTSTTGRTVGGSTVTINNINSGFNSSTVDAGVSFMVSSTGSGQIYNYHKATLKEADLLNLSNDINDFGNRYRVFAGEPPSNNDEGDLVFDTNANKMKVYDGSSWGEVTSTGDFKYLFLCPTGGSGAPTINGSIATYDLRESSNSGSAASITSAAQLIVSVNGVIQKANTGTSAPSEGFALVDGNTIVFGTNLPTGASVFIIQIGSAVTVPVPGDGTVSEAKIASGAVTTAKIADQAVTLAKLPHGDGSSDGKFLRANNGADPTFETVTLTTINNNADNRIITGSGTANTLNAESGITFSGTELKIGGDTGVAGTWGLEIYQSDTANNLGTALLAGNAGAELQLRDTVSGETLKIAANGQASFYSQKENDPMVFFTKPTGGSDSERLRITGDGNVGIGTNAPDNILHLESSSNPYLQLEKVGTSSKIYLGNSSGEAVLEATAGAIKLKPNGASNKFILDTSGRLLIATDAATGASTNADDLKIGNTDSGSQRGLTIGSAIAGNIRFADASDDTAGAIVYNHSNDRLAFYAASGQRASIDSNGLKFGSDTAAANALDDYEEGTWSPGGHWTTISAQYIKIGRMVYAGFSLRADTTGSSNVEITGLPFTAGNNKSAMGGIAWGLCEFASTGNWIGGCVDENTTTGKIFRGGQNLTFGSGSNNMNNSAFLRGTFIYYAAS